MAQIYKIKKKTNPNKSEFRLFFLVLMLASSLDLGKKAEQTYLQICCLFAEQNKPQ